MSFVASLFLALVPQQGPDIKLPPRKATETAPVVRPLTEIERFRRDLAEMAGPPAKVEARLQLIAQDYAPKALEALVLELARSARANEMANLMPVVQRFAGRFDAVKVADELLFQLLSRPLGEATRPVLETMAQLKGDGAKAALQECIRGRIAGVRRHAAEVLMPSLNGNDLEFVLQLTSEQTLDLQLRGVELLRALPDERASQRLVEMLSKDPSIAGAACAALVAQRKVAVPPLQRLLAGPAIDRGYAYAAFALAQINAHVADQLLADALAGPLVAQLKNPELLTRSLVAIPLADLSYRGVASATELDVRIVEALLDVVQPLDFVPNLELLRTPAEERLLRATGRLTFGTEVLPWRAWWQDQRATFTAVRARVPVDATNVAQAVVAWRHDQRHVRLLGEELADTSPVGNATEVVLEAPRMLALFAAMQELGFGDEVAMRVDSALPPVRSLQVSVPQGRMQVAMPPAQHPRFEAVVALVQRALDEEAWQLYRHTVDEPDRGAFWRAERRWRDGHPDPVERGRRFVHRVVANWNGLSAPLRARAIEHVVSHPQRKQLLDEEDGLKAIAALGTLPALTEVDLRLLELAAAVPGTKCWRAAVDLAVKAQGGGRPAVRAVFAVVGPDAVLQALQDDNPVVRRAGIEEVIVVRDQRAADRLVALLGDPDRDVQRAAIAAVGHLQIGAASRRLIDLIVADATPPQIRRDALRSLGRAGGDQAFPVLQRALLASDADDKDAAMRGLGELRDPRAAHVLAELVVVGHGKDLGALARLHLQRQSATNAIAALRAQLDVVRDAVLRDELALLLGGYHDVRMVPTLLDLLRRPQHATAAVTLLEGTTGQPFSESDERVEVAEAWFRQHKAEAQWQWLLDALQQANVPTSLRPEHFGGAQPLAPVAELARLLVELQQPRLWALVAAVLRTVAAEDYGVVTMQTPKEAREAIAARYRLLVEANRAAQGQGR
jgi:hypothetical protein